MAEEQGRSRLGRGLAALIGDVNAEGLGPDGAGAGLNARRVKLSAVSANPNNPRRVFDEAALAELADSIRARGLIQPLVVRVVRAPGAPPPPRGLGVIAGPRIRSLDPDASPRAHYGEPPERYEIIAGERRFRAAQAAGLAEAPVVVVEADDREVLELAIIENVQRADLNAVDEAAGYDRLVAEHGYTQDELARTVGKSRSHITNTLRLLKLPEPVKAWVREGALTAGHARALLSVPDPEAVGRRAIEEGLNVREIEAERRGASVDAPPAKGKARPGPKDADTLALEEALSAALGAEVSIVHQDAGRRRGGGEVRIRYDSLAQLSALCRRLDR